MAQAKGWVVFCIPQHPQVNGLEKEQQDKVIKWHFCVMLISCFSYFHIENLLSLCGPINLQPTMNLSSINLFSLPIKQPTWTSWIHIISYKVFCTYFFLSWNVFYWLNLTPPLSCTEKENEQFLSILLYATCTIPPFIFFFSTRKRDKSLHRSVCRNHWDIFYWNKNTSIKCWSFLMCGKT